MTDPSWSILYELPADIPTAKVIAEMAQKQIEKRGYGDEISGRVYQTVQEALINAARWGRGKLRLVIELYPDRIEADIWDEGKTHLDYDAMVRNACEDCSPEEMVKRIDGNQTAGRHSGIGILFMKKLSDDLEFSDVTDERGCKEGTRLHMVYRKR